MVIVIGKRCYWISRAVDSEGEVMDFLVQRKRDAKAAKKADEEAAQETWLRAKQDRDEQASVVSCDLSSHWP